MRSLFNVNDSSSSGIGGGSSSGNGDDSKVIVQVRPYNTVNQHNTRVVANLYDIGM